MRVYIPLQWERALDRESFPQVSRKGLISLAEVAYTYDIELISKGSPVIGEEDSALEIAYS
jgi:hypothetical protein